MASRSTGRYGSRAAAGVKVGTASEDTGCTPSPVRSRGWVRSASGDRRVPELASKARPAPVTTAAATAPMISMRLPDGGRSPRPGGSDGPSRGPAERFGRVLTNG